MSGWATAWAALLVAAFSFVPVPVSAGVADTPLPSFTDGQPSRLLSMYTGVVKRNHLQTDFVCTVSAPVAVDIGVEVFGPDGTRLNDVAAGAGAVLGVAPGRTVTIGTGGSAAFLETVVIVLPSVSQGSARVVATSAAVQCVALVVDGAVAPPTSLATLGAGVPLQTATDGPLPLPRFADGHSATHTLVVPGIVKRSGLDSDVFCTSLASAPLAIGVQVFAAGGAVQNDVAAGNGALLAVAPGATVTFGTTGTAAFLETTVITLPGIAQGLARVIATSADVICAAFVVDSALAPPTSLTELHPFAEPGAAPTSTPTVTPTATPIRPTRTTAPTPSPLAGCTGDCSGNGRVTVDELVTGVRIVLGAAGIGTCTAFDFNDDGHVEVNELVRAVNVLLYGCVP